MAENSLKTSFIFNLVGPALRVAIALVTVPIYVRHLGAARYGVVSISWVLLGYFGFLDLGLSRAAINALAKLRNAPQSDRARVLLTVLVLNLGFSVIGSIALYLVGSYVLEHFISIPDDLRPEVASAFPWVATFLPLALIAMTACGAIESRERFLLSNALQILSFCLTQIAPVVAAVVVGPQLTVVIPVTAMAQTVSVLITLAVVYRLEGPFKSFVFDRREARALLSYGGWVSLSNFVYPFIASADQLLIGSVMGVARVPFYSVPMSLVLRLSTIPQALGRTFFPRMSSLSREAAHALGSRALSAVGYGFGAICAPGIILAPTFFRYWMGADFAAQAGPVAQILFVGAWMNGLSFMAYTQLQGQGRPDLTGKLHIAEVLPFLAVLWFLTTTWGIVGAAIAWTLRGTFEAFAMFWAAGLRKSDVISILRPAALLCACLAVGQIIGSNLIPAFLAAFLMGSASLALAYGFSEELRRLMIAQSSRARSLVGRPVRRARPGATGQSDRAGMTSGKSRI